MGIHVESKITGFVRRGCTCGREIKGRYITLVVLGDNRVAAGNKYSKKADLIQYKYVYDRTSMCYITLLHCIRSPLRNVSSSHALSITFL